jgi:hypothetical protein
MTCTVERRKHAREAADALRACESVVAVDVLDPTTEPRQCWSIEVMAERVGPTVFRVAARHGLASPQIASQADWQRAVFVLA